MNYNITLENIAIEAISELKNEISSEIKNSLILQYRVSLNEFKSLISEYFDKFNKDFREKYTFYFNKYRNFLLNRNEKINSSFNEITSITTLIKEGFENGLNYSLNEFENLINEGIFLKIINNEEKINIIFNELFDNISFSVPNIELNLENNINNLKLICDQELKKEEDIFKDNILELIVKGFNYTVKTFMNEKGKSFIENIFLNDYENKIMSKLDYILNKFKEIDEYIKLVIDGLYNINSYVFDSIKEVYYLFLNYINDGLNQNKLNIKILKKIMEFKYDSAKKIVYYFNSYILDILNSNLLKNKISPKVQFLIPNDIPSVIKLNMSKFYYDLFNYSILENIYNTYNIQIIEKKEKIIQEVNKLRMERINQIENNVQSPINDPLASTIVEYKNLNDSFSEISNDFLYNLSDTKKTNIYNLLSNQTLKKYLQEIPNKYMQCYNYIQNNISHKVLINVDLKDFKKNLNSPNLDNFEEIGENFKTKLDEIFKNFEIKTNYNQQINNNKTIKSINFNSGNLNNNIQIESIQSIINQIDIKFSNLFKIQNKNLIKI